MTAPPPPAPGAAPWMETGRVLGRSVVLHLWSGLVAWRWLLLTAVFILGAILIEDTLTFYFKKDEIPRAVDAWDLFPAMLSHRYFVLFLFAFGFLLLIGDSFQREREQGTAALFAVRMPSRSIYWLGKIGAVGLLAALFVALCLVLTLLVGLVLAPPSTAWPQLPRPALEVMYLDVAMPLPVYTLLLAGYTMWALWTIGSVILLVSLLVRHRVAILVAIAAWLAASVFVDTFGALRLLRLGDLLSIHKHRGDAPISPACFFAASGAVLVLTALAGSWRLRREEL